MECFDVYRHSKVFVKISSLKLLTSRNARSTPPLFNLSKELLYTRYMYIKLTWPYVLCQLISQLPSSLSQIHSLFSILTLSHAYVTSIGRLIGVVTLADVSTIAEYLLSTIYSCS